MGDGLTELSGRCSLNLRGEELLLQVSGRAKGISQVGLPDQEGGRGN